MIAASPAYLVRIAVSAARAAKARSGEDARDALLHRPMPVLPGESGSMLASDFWLQARRDVVSRLVASRLEG